MILRKTDIINTKTHYHKKVLKVGFFKFAAIQKAFGIFSGVTIRHAIT